MNFFSDFLIWIALHVNKTTRFSRYVSNQLSALSVVFRLSKCFPISLTSILNIILLKHRNCYLTDILTIVAQYHNNDFEYSSSCSFLYLNVGCFTKQRRHDFSFPIVNFTFLYMDITLVPSHDFYICQFVRFANVGSDVLNLNLT